MHFSGDVVLDLQKILKRFYDKIKFNSQTGCWEWQASCNQYGYGQFVVPELDERAAHRVSFRIFKGEILPGMQICHRCDNRKCITPDHLFQGTIQDNSDDKMRKGRDKPSNRGKLFCKRNHPLFGSNMIVDSSGKRQCKICMNLRYKKWKDKKKCASTSR